MSDPFLDLIEKSIENGDIPQEVTNREILAALRIMDNNQNTTSESHGVRIGLLEKWQNRAIDVATRGNRGDAIPRLKKNLALYKSGKPCRTPW